MKKLISAGVILFRREGEQYVYLLLHYPAGHWDFPKGKMETGESKEQTALRELQEETGLTAQIYDNFCESFSYIFTDLDGKKTEKTVYFLVGETLKKEVILSDEHIDYVWLPYEQAVEKLTYENSKQTLKKSAYFIHGQ